MINDAFVDNSYVMSEVEKGSLADPQSEVTINNLIFEISKFALHQ